MLTKPNPFMVEKDVTRQLTKEWFQNEKCNLNKASGGEKTVSIVGEAVAIF